MIIDKRTKIITTIGPVSEAKETIVALFEAGMNTIRLNFSHGDYEEQGKRIETVKQLRQEQGLPISIMLDTKGPEIRVGNFVNGKQAFVSAKEIAIYCDSESYKNKVCTANEMTVSYDMSQDLKPGKKVLIDDGKLQLEVLSVKPGLITAKTLNHHIVKNNKRVNLPGTKFSIPFLAQKDINDIEFGCQKGIDFIAASFVNTAKDIKEIRAILKKQQCEHVQIFSKIESQYAVDHFDEILAETDGVMIARGDLGLEIPYYEVPVVQKMIIRKMRAAGKPVIVATQMLDSMEKNPQPTRAEVTDVYFATELGADATMLSGESAAGEYPIRAVEVMSTINKRAEKEFYNKTYYEKYLNTLPFEDTDRGHKAKEVTLRTQDGDFKFAVVLSRTGKLLSKVASLRPNTSIIGVTNNVKQLTQFGVTSSVFMHQDDGAFNQIKADKNEAKKVVAIFGAKKGDKYLVVENEDLQEFTF